MGAARATVLLAAMALFAAAAPPLWASEPQVFASEPAEAAPASAEAIVAEPSQAATEQASPPAAVVTAPSEPKSEPASAAEVALPEIPGAPVAITAPDRFPSALAARLAESQGALHPRLSRKEREAMAAFYALGNYQPLWVRDGAWTEAARTVIERLKSADEDGLKSADYPIPVLASPSASDTVDETVEAELKLSAAAVVYARDARGGRIEPSRLSALITPDLALPAADAVLTALGSAKDAGAALAAYNPQHPGYLALKAKLAEARAGQGAQARLEGDLVANMERWRWLPPDLGQRYIFVNVPEFKLRLMKDGRAIHEARVIVGKPDTPTPLFSDEMEHAVVNPSWYVPPSIFKNEFNSDPAVAAARGYEVIYGRNGAVTLRQPPSERNALGFIKFMFPNKHAVYLHDTPSRRLFASEKRAFSHGCVRLDQPFRFGQLVLGAEWTEARLKSLIGKGERTIRLPEKIPVHLAYFTLFVDDKGELRHFADIYGVDNKVRRALGLPHDGASVPVAAAPRPHQAAPAQARHKPASPVRVVARTPRPVRTVGAPMPVEQPFFWWFR